MLKIVSIVIRVNDLAAQSRFWQAALDYVERDPASDDWVVLKLRDADTPCIALDAHHSERALPPRIHLDIYAEDQAAEVRRLAELGARGCTGTSCPRMPTTSSWKTPRATGSASSTARTGRGGRVRGEGESSASVRATSVLDARVSAVMSLESLDVSSTSAQEHESIDHEPCTGDQDPPVRAAHREVEDGKSESEAPQRQQDDRENPASLQGQSLLNQRRLGAGVVIGHCGSIASSMP